MALAFCSFASYILGQKKPLGRQGRKAIGLYPKFREDQFVDYNGIIFISKMKPQYSILLFSLFDLLNLYRLVRYLI